MEQWKEPSNWKTVHEKHPELSVGFNREYAVLRYKDRYVTTWDKKDVTQGFIAISAVTNVIEMLKSEK